MSNLQEIQEAIREIVGESFAQASDHSFSCTCPICRDWWLRMGPEEDSMKFGPFGDTLWKDYAERRNMTVEEAKEMCASMDI